MLKLDAEAMQEQQDAPVQKLYFVNAVKAQNVIVSGAACAYKYQVLDCMGNVCGDGVICAVGMDKISVPTGGMVVFEQK